MISILKIGLRWKLKIIRIVTELGRRMIANQCEFPTKFFLIWTVSRATTAHVSCSMWGSYFFFSRIRFNIQKLWENLKQSLGRIGKSTRLFWPLYEGKQKLKVADYVAEFKRYFFLCLISSGNLINWIQF